MKIRWTDESLRLRITPSELASLVDGKPLSESLGDAWEVVVCGAPQKSKLLFSGSRIEFQIGKSDFDRLVLPDSEGAYFVHGAIRCAIEKDFPCVHPRGSELAEPHTETFAPPADFEARKLQ